MALFDAATRRRGEAYYNDNRVVNACCVKPGKSYYACVQGGGLYNVHLDYDSFTGWSGKCSCPLRQKCKHVYAALKHFLVEHNQALVQGLSSGTFRPGGVLNQTADQDMAMQPADAAFVEQIKSALKRPLHNEELAFLRKLHDRYIAGRRRDDIRKGELAGLGLHLNIDKWSTICPAYPNSLHRFWLFIAHAVQEMNGTIPEFMRPVTDLSQIADEIAQLHWQCEIDKWKLALGSDAPYRAANLFASRETVDLRLRIGNEGALLECKSTKDAEFKPLTGMLLRKLKTDLQLGRVEMSLQSEYLWNSVETHLAFRNNVMLNYAYDSDTAILGKLFRQPLLQDYILAQDGRPIRHAMESLTWSIAPDGATGDNYRFHLVKADGTPAPPLLCAMDGTPALYLSENTLFKGPRIISDVVDPIQGAQVPAPALESAEGVRLLDFLAAPVPERIERLMDRQIMQVCIQGELRAIDDSGREYCLLRITAESPDGKVRESWNGYSWNAPAAQAQSAAAPAAGKRIAVYDRSLMAQAPALLYPIELTWEPSLGGLCLRVTRKFPQLFAEWLKTLPSWVILRLEGELASLAEDAIAGRIRLEVTETEIDWFDLQVVLDVASMELTPEELKLLLNAKGQYVRLQGKGWRRLNIDLSQEDDEQLARLGLNPHELTSDRQRMHALQLADDAARKFLPERQADQIQRRAGEIKARVTPPLPDGLHVELRPYQVEGFHFLAYLAANHFGGILADDMGLGKTLQALTWLLWLRQTTEPRPSLVVCPKSVMDNWRAEANRFIPGLRVKVWTAAELNGFAVGLPEAGLHVINYNQLRILGQDVVSIRWLALILDEGQYIKNPNSQTAQAARALHASHRLILSGTPIENKLLDLWSLMAFAMPGVLGSRQWFGRHFDGKNDALARRRLSARVRPFLLRRTKNHVAKDLPDKIEEELYCEIEGEQLTLYRAELKFAQQLLLKIKTQKELAHQQFHFLVSLLRLRQICCHPALVKPDSKAESAKVNALLDVLGPLMEDGQKVLVFSQFVELLELLKRKLDQHGYPLFMLTGQTENRGELVENFQNAPGAAVFLISLKAGGFGLNLTAASYVVMFDPWWNPAVENQAIDRTHRIGQVNKVIAYRLLIKDSVEEKIRVLQKKKSQLAGDILGEEKFAQSLTLQDLHFLLADG